MVPIRVNLPKALQFVHRKNQDGTIDSICGLCARTVATAADAAGLIELEAMHRCSESSADSQ